MEELIGIRGYITKTPGTGGVIRKSPEDFVVEEIPVERNLQAGKYLIVEVKKKNWDTHLFVRALARALEIPERYISWAGTKDKRAVTVQRFSILGVDESRISEVRIRDAEIRVLGRSHQPISLGDLIGNLFKIVIRDAKHPERAERITEEIKEIGGVPNFFGEQRFGTTRPISHLVGEKLLKGDYRGAFFTYVAMPFEEERKEVREARRYILETEDLEKGLELLPRYLKYERMMIRHVLKRPGDFRGAFEILPRNLRMMFAHAYQSYLFNLIVSRRMERGLPLNDVVIGDIVCFMKGGVPETERLREVDERNIETIRKLVKEGRALPTAPIIGESTPLASGEPGEIEREILKDSSSLNFRDSTLNTSGMRRPIIVPVSPECDIKDEILLRFSLFKGAYATSVLREYLKSKDPISD
ncbi:MAG: tRNA pseudouridine(13) synthase TruD [Archaeoglobi archaeon]|nr:tRNA pseudouridine(13) synthase TruD [Candidatus Mnemosynella sp.]